MALRPRLSSVLSLLWLAGATHSHAQPVSQAHLCENIVGTVFTAPSWKADEDGFSGSALLLQFKTNAPSKIQWIREGKVYYEAEGAGIVMKSGYVIVVIGDEYTETYVFNAATTELLFGAIRSGSAIHPNSIKSFRGICKPAGAMVR